MSEVLFLFFGAMTLSDLERSAQCEKGKLSP